MSAPLTCVAMLELVVAVKRSSMLYIVVDNYCQNFLNYLTALLLFSLTMCHYLEVLLQRTIGTTTCKHLMSFATALV